MMNEQPTHPRVAALALLQEISERQKRLQKNPQLKHESRQQALDHTELAMAQIASVLPIASFGFYATRLPSNSSVSEAPSTLERDAMSRSDYSRSTPQ